MKTATISKIGSPREWAGQNGNKVYFTDVVLSDGATVSLGRKTPDAIKAGDQVHYEIDANGKAKEVRQQSNRGGWNGSSRSQGSPASFALSYSKDVAIALIAKSDKDLTMDQLATTILKTADRFNEWLKANQ